MDFKRLLTSTLLRACTPAFGTFGYHIVEGMTFFDSFYMTIITISTVGFAQINPLATPGRSRSSSATGCAISPWTQPTRTRF
ncbi:MAG TPA: potassium channel family protein [Spirochaetota bacterium]|nr:potassium channel family protein [Spirochaetota bacterium]